MSSNEGGCGSDAESATSASKSMALVDDPIDQPDKMTDDQERTLRIDLKTNEEDIEKLKDAQVEMDSDEKTEDLTNVKEKQNIDSASSSGHQHDQSDSQIDEKSESLVKDMDEKNETIETEMENISEDSLDDKLEVEKSKSTESNEQNPSEKMDDDEEISEPEAKNEEIDSKDTIDLSKNIPSTEKVSLSTDEVSTKTKKSNVITEVVIASNDEVVTLDLSKTLINGSNIDSPNKESSRRRPLSENSVNQMKRHRSGSLTMAEDLSLPSSKRRNNNCANGDEDAVCNGSNGKDDDLMDSSPDGGDTYGDGDGQESNDGPNDITTNDNEYLKQKLIRKLKQQLFNEEMKLLFLKKIRQSQLKENISQQHQQQQQNNANNSTNNYHSQITNHHPPSAATLMVNNHHSTTQTNLAATNVVGVNLATNLRESFNILAANYHPSQAGVALNNSVLNFSMNPHHHSLSKNSTNNSANLIINNNAAHSNNHPSSVLSAKNHFLNFNPNNQAPMQAHVSKSKTRDPSGPVLNPPYASLGRSPYNYLNNPLSGPPPSNLHGSKRGVIGHDLAHSLNTAHSNKSNRTMGNSSSPNIASHTYPDMRHSSSNKHNQIPPSISPSTNATNQTSIDNKATAEALLIQKQLANFKQAMRKHLEKTPQPKVIPPEMHFIPNPSNAEFIYYVGLETVVNYLTGSNQTQQPPEPFECVQCGTDFTPVWKWKDRSNPHKPSVICEKCVLKNMKKIISDDYQKEVNNYAKTFEEIEKHLATATSVAGSLTPPTAAISPSVPSNEAANIRGPPPPPPPQPTLPPQPRQSNPFSNSNMFGSNQNPVAAAAAAANFNFPQAHTNPSLSGLSPQMAAMAALLMPQQTNNQPVSTPPAAHSGSSRSSASSSAAVSSSNFNSNLSAAFGAPTANSPAQTAAAALTFLQQLQSLPKINQAQSLLLAQQLLAGTNPAATTANNPQPNNPMAQLFNFPLLYSSFLMASFANQQKSQPSQTSPLNAAAASITANIPQQLLMEMLPNLGGARSSSGHHSRNGGGGTQSMPQHNWKS